MKKHLTTLEALNSLETILKLDEVNKQAKKLISRMEKPHKYVSPDRPWDSLEEEDWDLFMKEVDDLYQGELRVEKGKALNYEECLWKVWNGYKKATD